MDQVRMQYLRIYTRYMENEDAPCPYCGHGVGYADLHDDNCQMLDIIAYIDNGVPMPLDTAASETGSGDVSGADADADALFAVAQNSGNYDDMRAAMFALYSKLLITRVANDANVQRIRDLEAALKWYADGENYVDPKMHDYIDLSPIADDLGNKAREALAAHTALDAGNGEGAL